MPKFEGVHFFYFKIFSRHTILWKQVVENATYPAYNMRLLHNSTVRKINIWVEWDFLLQDSVFCACFNFRCSL